MIWAVVWAPRFERATGEGAIRRGELANEWRLYVGSYCVHMLLDVQARTVTAETAYRLR